MRRRETLGIDESPVTVRQEPTSFGRSDRDLPTLTIDPVVLHVGSLAEVVTLFRNPRPARAC
jgi:hypothetical protein